MTITKRTVIRVKTKEELLKLDYYYRSMSPHFISVMDQYMGQTGFVIQMIDFNKVKISVDGGKWSWCIDWLKVVKNAIYIDNKLFKI